MITKSKIFQHALWGGIFGLISGLIVGYGDTYGGNGIYDFLSVNWLPHPVPAFIQRYLVFLVPGLFLGLALGVADKSFKKIFYGILGGLMGGLIFYTAVRTLEIYKVSIPEKIPGFIVLLVFLFSPTIYAIFICSALGIMYKSFYRAIKGMIGSVIALTAISPLIFFLLMIYALGADWSLGNYDILGNLIASLLAGFTLWGASLTTAIFIGTELCH